MKKITVNYSVEYQCELEVSPEEDLEDRISDIDIPEGGHNNSRYVSDSFIWLTHSEIETSGGYKYENRVYGIDH